MQAGFSVNLWDFEAWEQSQCGPYNHLIVEMITVPTNAFLWVLFTKTVDQDRQTKSCVPDVGSSCESIDSIWQEPNERR